MNRSLTSLPPMNRLRPFEAAIRLGSFAAAAVELRLTPTAVSKQIKALERDLGVLLFERRNRAVFPTDEGRRFGAIVSSALSEIAIEAAHLRGARQAGGVVLHCQVCEAFYWLMPRLLRFHERHPGVDVRVVSAFAALAEAQEPYDVAIQTTGRPSGAARLAFTASDEVFPVCAPSLLDDAETPLLPASLDRFVLLSHRVVPQDWMDWPDWYDTIAIPQPSGARIIHFDSFPLALQAAVSGQGVALGWRRTVGALIDEGKLAKPCREVVFRPAEISVYRGFRRGDPAQKTALLDWLREEFSQDW